jgi:signal transduction histidine kinase
MQLQTASNGLRIQVMSQDSDFPPFPAAIEVAVYRIVQEGLTNVVRHAKASECTVDMSMLQGKSPSLQIKIDDDGLGIPEDLHPGVGITSMRERAAELGGYCNHIANDSKGTLVVAVLPIQQVRIP